MSHSNVTPAFFKLISDDSIVAIIVLDRNNRTIYMNRSAKDLLECPMEFDDQLLTIQSLFPQQKTENKTKTLCADTLEQEGFLQEVLVQKQNGQLFTASLGLRKLISQNDEYRLLMIQDISFQKKLQREIIAKQSAIQQAYHDLLSQNQKLKELDLAKNRFIAVTTHELRTPLSAIVASSEILKMKLYDTEEQRQEFVDMIYDQGHHMLTLVNDILDFAKIQSNKMDYYIEERSLDKVVENEVTALQSMAHSSQVELNYTQPNEPTICFFDEVRMRQVISNLVNNAIKYNMVKGQVFIHIDQNEDWVIVHIRDTGRGIAKNDLEKVFNEFETLGKIAHHAKGTGLGLPISQKMIRAMGGEIHLTSELGVGSTFSIEIPRKKILAAEVYRSRPASTATGDLVA